MKTVYLHMGFHKTATSSFQATCKNNIRELNSQGYEYPLFECLKNGKERIVANHSTPLLTVFGTNPVQNRQVIKWNLDDLEKEVLSYRKQLDLISNTEKNLIISGEGLSTFPKQDIVKLVEYFKAKGFGIKPIVAVRTPLSFHCSSVQQRVKGGGNVDFTKLNSQINKVKKLQSIFGDELQFVSFEDLCGNSLGPVLSLLRWMQVDTDNIAQHKMNESVGNLYVRVQNILNTYNPKIRNGRLNRLHFDVPKLGGRKFTLNQNEQSLISKELELENQWMYTHLGAQFADSSYKCR